MSEEVTITEATREDASAVLTLLKQLDEETETFTVEDDLTKLTVDIEACQLELIQQSHENLVLLAKYQNQAIGLATVMKDETHKLGEVGVAVLKSFWNQGLGTALVEETITWGKSFSWLPGLMLTVQKRNQGARHIYKKLGFEEIQSNKKGFQDKNGIFYAMVDMQLQFS